MQSGHHQHHHQVHPGTAAMMAEALETTGPADVVVELEAGPVDWSPSPDLPTLRAWGYNGQLPGPVIEARVGQVLEVRFTNLLPEPTTIHWHGLRVPAVMDGTESTQRPVEPGERFTYRFRLPDAGTFWYHSHSNETVQLERGLYGALIVRGEDEPVLDTERVLVLDDLKLDKEGDFAKFGGLIQRHDGREGDVRLVNGIAEPTLGIAAGQVERWRVVNASSARYIRLSIGGAPFQILGTDGGLLEAPVEATEVLLATADRVDLAVGPFAEGQELAVEALPYFRGITKKRKTERFATLQVGPARPSLAEIPERLRTIEPLVTGPVSPTRTVKLGFQLSLRRGVDFVINGEKHHRGEPVKVGELQVWDLVNETLMDHPFHLHGFFFQVLEVNGSPPAYRSWEDTVNVPPKSTIRIAWMPDDRPGEWMAHCHILEHHASGMMTHFQVER